jgi:hypothetical protein
MLSCYLTPSPFLLMTGFVIQTGSQKGKILSNSGSPAPHCNRATKYFSIF